MSSEYVGAHFQHNGYTVKIIADNDAESPRDWDDNGLFIVTTRNRYFEVLHEGNTATDCADDKELNKTHWRFPVNAYIHSGVALSLDRDGQFSDPWDSGQIGFVFAAKSEWKYRTRDTKRCGSAYKAAAGLVETWNQYLSGDVWGFQITDADGTDVDSCWGFYGLEYAKQEAMANVPSDPCCPADSTEDMLDVCV